MLSCQINCTAPSNFGRGHRLAVTAAGQTCEPASFAYDGPVIIEVIPSTVDAVAGSDIVIRGHNFGLPLGAQDEPLEVAIGTALCSQVQLFRESEVWFRVSSYCAHGF